ncbi:MAG: hypothetical protein EA419_06500 [Wenzhouxiangella sp.]|nr:MAG: hypothetical protein EA419_06500 [Wenzhouxiangella sp.]
MRGLSLLPVLAFALAALALAPAAVAEEPLYLVEAELHIDGVQRGTPSMMLAAGSPASLETGSDEDGYRLEVEIEPVSASAAPANSLWLHVAVFERVDGGWEELVDSILGVPEGDTATLSVVDGDAMATPETAAVYLRIRVSREPVPEAEPAGPTP